MVRYSLVAMAGAAWALPLNINLGAYSPALVVGDGEISFGGNQDVTNLMNALEGAAVSTAATVAGNAAAGTTTTTTNAGAAAAGSAENAAVTANAASDPLLQEQQISTTLQGLGKEIAPRVDLGDLAGALADPGAAAEAAEEELGELEDATGVDDLLAAVGKREEGAAAADKRSLADLLGAVAANPAAALEAALSNPGAALAAIEGALGGGGAQAPAAPAAAATAAAAAAAAGVAKRDLTGFDRALKYAEAALTKGPKVELGTGKEGSGVGILVDPAAGTATTAAAGTTNAGAAAAAAAPAAPAAGKRGVSSDAAPPPKQVRAKVTTMYVRAVPGTSSGGGEAAAAPAAARAVARRDSLDAVNLNVDGSQVLEMTFVETVDGSED